MLRRISETVQSPHRQTPQQRLAHRRYEIKRKRRLHGRKPHRLTPAQRRAIQRLKSIGFYKKLARFRESTHAAYVSAVISAGAQIKREGVNEETVADLVASFVNRPSAISSTPAGLSALMFEAVLATHDNLATHFVDTEIQNETLYFAVFDAPVSETDLTWLKDAGQNIVESFKVVVEKGQNMPDGEGMVSDYSVIECVAKETPYLQPDKEQVREMQEEGVGMTDCQFDAAYEAEVVGDQAETYEGVWERDGGLWRPAVVELEEGQTTISRTQALALHGGRTNLLPKPGESHRQPADASGEYFIGQTHDKKFYTEHRPKKNESDDSANDGPTTITATFPDPAALRAASKLIETESGVLPTHNAERLTASFKSRKDADSCIRLINANFKQVKVAMKSEAVEIEEAFKPGDRVTWDHNGKKTKGVVAGPSSISTHVIVKPIVRKAERNRGVSFGVDKAYPIHVATSILTKDV